MDCKIELQQPIVMHVEHCVWARSKQNELFAKGGKSDMAASLFSNPFADYECRKQTGMDA
jgi:hypothetical protein